MAKDLSAQTGVQADANYINGKLVNAVTKCGVGVNQDLVQVWQKLMDLAGITPNGLDDNEANGYQFILALASYIKSFRLLGTDENLDFNDQYTSTTSSYSKTKTKEIIFVTNNSETYRYISLGDGVFTGEKCIVLMYNNGGQGIIVRKSVGVNLFTVDADGYYSKEFIWTGSEWRIVSDYLPNASSTDKGVVEKALLSEAESGDADKFIDAELMQTANGKAWQTPTLNAGFSFPATQPLRYRINRGKLELRGGVFSTSATGTAFTLPSGYRPIEDTAIFASNVNFGIPTSAIHGVVIQSSGAVVSDSWSTGNDNVFNCAVILD